MKVTSMKAGITRRTAIKTAVAAGFPVIIPTSVLGATAPSKRINIGAIGVGRISRTHDMREVLKHRDAHIVAVCDLDTHRLAAGQKLVDEAYAARDGKPYSGTRIYGDHHALLANADIDAVLISTPIISMPDWRSMPSARARMSISRSPPRSPLPRGARWPMSPRRPIASSRSARSSAPWTLAAVPPRLRAGAQWPHRQADPRGGGAAG
jgi:hypothetical protein